VLSSERLLNQLLTLRKGRFITIEGPNGVGKTTMANAITTQLLERGIPVHPTCEPTNSSLGRLVRHLGQHLEGRTYACLIAADRYHHIEQEIIPALDKGQIVLSARYVESSLVLQRLDDVDLDFIWAVNSFILVPDLSIILTASADILSQRLKGRQEFSRFELSASRKDELDFYYDAAQFLASKGFNILTLDNGDVTLGENVQRVVTEIEMLISRHQYGNAT